MEQRLPRGLPRLRHLAIVAAALGIFLTLTAGTPRAAETEADLAGPTAVVETLHAALLDSMQARGIGTAARAERLRPVVNASFDFPTIARVVLGRVWGTLTDGERERFLAVFSELSVVTYAARFDSHTDERFVTLGSAPGRAEGEALVRTNLQRPASGKPPVSLHYLLRRGPDGVWRVVNVVADGVSDLSLKRTEYAGILKGGNIASLIERLEAQIRDLLNGEAKA